ncbi:MAG: nucleotidyltransferase [Lachnospiraceae bacterium]|nr:nucleotidyltransferase [Lachnospiraceae bacterium]
MDFKKIMRNPEYDFLRTNPRLSGRIILLGLGGSYAYGTSNADSDIDFRGVTLPLRSDLLGLTSFEQYEDSATDTVIYSFNKMVKLLLECNPNTCEILGLDEEQYLIKTEIGQELIDNSGLFLSQRAAKSFGGYAGAQLRRLQNAIARDSMPQAERERHILNSVQNTLEDFQRRYGEFEYGTVRLYLDQAVTAGMDTEIFVDASQNHMPLRDFQKMFGALNNVIRDYDKIGKRNKKKDGNHLNKHAMHLIRLFLMAIDILERGEIRTHRVDDVKLLLDIRSGVFFKEDGTFDREFYRILGEYEERLKSAAEHSVLPKQPDMDKVEAFVESVNQRALDSDNRTGKGDSR